MNTLLVNFLKTIKSPVSLGASILGFLLILLPSLHFIDKELMILSYGYNFYLVEIISTVIIAILFGIFIGSTLYKMSYFSVKKSGAGMFGGFFGVLVVGCPSCSITFASYMGLAGIVSILPYGGLEVKILSIFLLLYACYSTLKNLETCSLKKK